MEAFISHDCCYFCFFFHKTIICTTIANMLLLPPTTELSTPTPKKMSTATTTTTATQIAKEIEDVNKAVTQALLNGDIVDEMKMLHSRIVSTFPLNWFYQTK